MSETSISTERSLPKRGMEDEPGYSEDDLKERFYRRSATRMS